MLENPFEGKQVWFLTGSQDLYGEETLRQVDAQSRQIVQTLGKSQPVPVVWQPVLKDAKSIRQVAHAANADPDCVGVIAWMHTFSPAKMWIQGMADLQKPLLQFHTQANEALPWDTIDMDFMNLNQSAHGDREFGYLLTRLRKPRKIVVGHATHAEVQDEVSTWIRAALGRDALKNLAVARFGDNMRNVAVTEGDKTEAEIKLGVSTNTWGVNDLVAVVDAVSDSEVDALIDQYRDRYEIAPELLDSRADSLRYAARIEAGLRCFLRSGNFGAFTTNFEDLGGLQQLPGLAVQRLMADGYGFGAEGDWKTAILVRLAKVMGFGRDGGASLMEDYCYELTPGKQKILGAHMLEICPSLTTSKPRMEVHPLGIGGREDPVRLVFDADAGDGLVVALSDMRNRFRLTANEVDIVPPDAPLPKLPVARAVWQPKPSFGTSAKCWLHAGGAHHTVLTTNTTTQMWLDLAEMLDVELALIDADTTERAFARELQLSDLFYRFRG